MSNEWRQLEPVDAFAFLNAVRDDKHMELFEPSLCDVYLHPLDFFDGYDLIRISCKYSQPFVLLDYVSNGENHYYLDGSDFALQTLCTQRSVRVDEDNVLDYIDLYFSYVYERGNTVVYVRNHEGFTPSVTLDSSGDFFIIHTHLIYQDEMREAQLRVHKTGRIDIISPADVSFMDAPIGVESIPYPHPKGANIIEQTKALLSASETAREYLANAEGRGIEIEVFSSPNYQSIATNKPMIYLFMPAAQFTADYHQALLLAGALHDTQQIIDGYKRPSINEDAAVFFDINHDKNLKLIAGICKIVEELEELEISEAVTAMDNLGLAGVYEGFKNDVSAHALMDTYIQALRDRGIIIGG